MKKDLNYTQAFEELQSIISEMETGEISVDELTEKVKRATVLITFCKDMLKSTETDVNKILKTLEDEQSQH